MHLISIPFLVIAFTVNIYISQANNNKQDELSLRNDLFADVDIIRDNVNSLKLSVDILNKRYKNQMDILEAVHNKYLNDPDFDDKDATVCNRLTGMFNATYKKYNSLETRIATKLEEIQEYQNTRLDEISASPKLSRNCASKVDSPNILALMSDTLTEVSERINSFETRFEKLAEALNNKLNYEQTNFQNLTEDQMKITLEINDKLAKNQAQFEKINQELTSLKELKTNVNRVLTNPRPKLPMEVILGLTSSNITSLK